MSFDTALLDIVCCPITRQPLNRLPPGRAERVNALIDARSIRNRGGSVLDEHVEQWLMTRDGRLAYPVRDGIPVLLEDEAIELSQLDER